MSRLTQNHGLNMTVLRVVVGLGTFGFVIWMAATTFSGFSFSSVEPLPLVFSALLYVASVAALPVFWMLLLKAYAPDGGAIGRGDKLQLVLVYSRSWIARYVPGRIWMFGGRVLYGSAMGIPKWTVLKTTIVEGLMLQVIMLWLAGATLFAFFGQWLAAAGLGVLLPALLVFYLKDPDRVIAFVPINRLRELMKPPATRSIVIAFIYGVLINASLLASMALLADAVIEVDGVSAWKISALWGFSAVAGYLTVVTPAGLGVREAVGVVLLGTVVDRADAALFMGASRAVGLAVDLVLALGVEAYAQGVRGKFLLRRPGANQSTPVITRNDQLQGRVE